MTSPPLFLADPLPAVGPFVLEGAEGRHAAVVRRLRRGEPLLLSDGRGSVASCLVEGVDGARGLLRLDVRHRWSVAQPALRVVLAQALVKGDRGELAVELATEAGVDAVLPWRAARSVARWDDGPRGARALQRWRTTAREAAKQSRRAWLPPVAEPVSTAGLVRWVAGSTTAVVLGGSADTPLAAVPLPPAGELVLVVGPEGGIADDELSALVGAGAVPARLGPTVLRSATAAAVALGALGVLTDRWSLTQTSGT